MTRDAETRSALPGTERVDGAGSSSQGPVQLGSPAVRSEGGARGTWETMSREASRRLRTWKALEGPTDFPRRRAGGGSAAREGIERPWGTGGLWEGGDRPLLLSFDPEETYERLEADKKKQVHKKRKCPGPIITYHSVTVPLVGEPGPREETVDVEG